jgi:Asp-tRNA(Asn)/Glu-tRNA(Gln) amidotransferase A subunit family amidase
MLYKTGELTPTSVAVALLPLIQQDTSPPGEHSVNWFELRSDLILESAQASTARYKQGKPRGLLDGVPQQSRTSTTWRAINHALAR